MSATITHDAPVAVNPNVCEYKNTEYTIDTKPIKNKIAVILCNKKRPIPLNASVTFPIFIFSPQKPKSSLSI